MNLPASENRLPTWTVSTPLRGTGHIFGRAACVRLPRRSMIPPRDGSSERFLDFVG